MGWNWQLSDAYIQDSRLIGDHGPKGFCAERVSGDSLQQSRNAALFPSLQSHTSASKAPSAAPFTFTGENRGRVSDVAEATTDAGTAPSVPAVGSDTTIANWEQWRASSHRHPSMSLTAFRRLAPSSIVERLSTSAQMQILERSDWNVLRAAQVAEWMVATQRALCSSPHFLELLAYLQLYDFDLDCAFRHLAADRLLFPMCNVHPSLKGEFTAPPIMIPAAAASSQRRPLLFHPADESYTKSRQNLLSQARTRVHTTCVKPFFNLRRKSRNSEELSDFKHQNWGRDLRSDRKSADWLDRDAETDGGDRMDEAKGSDLRMVSRSQATANGFSEHFEALRRRSTANSGRAFVRSETELTATGRENVCGGERTVTSPTRVLDARDAGEERRRSVCRES